MLNKMKTLIKPGLNLKLVIVSEYRNTKTILLKDKLHIGQKKFLSLAKLKVLFRGLMLLVTRMVNPLLEVFMRKNFKRQIKKYKNESILP